MTSGRRFSRDLIVLVADKDQQSLVTSVLSRPDSLGIKPIAFDTKYNPTHDAGTRTQHYEILRSFLRTHEYALVLFDREGCGVESRSAEEIEENVVDELSACGWRGRCKAIVIDPEVEIWIWSDSPHVDKCLGWHGRDPSLRTWLRERGEWVVDQKKPLDPKKAYLDALRQVRKSNSSSIFSEVGRKVSLSRCSDPSFMRFKNALRTWFPA